jgi:hypothetical protein
VLRTVEREVAVAQRTRGAGREELLDRVVLDLRFARR